jgi:hypothetical protein
MRSPALFGLVMIGGLVAEGVDLTEYNPDPAAPMIARAEALIIPKLELQEVTIFQAVETVRALARQVDPAGLGVPISVQLLTEIAENPASNTGPVIPGPEMIPKPSAPAGSFGPVSIQESRITVSLANVPVAEALRYVANLAGLSVQPTPSGFLLRASTGFACGPITKQINLPPEIFAPTPPSEFGSPTVPRSGSIYIPSRRTYLCRKSEQDHAILRAVTDEVWAAYYATEVWKEQEAWQERKRAGR